MNKNIGSTWIGKSEGSKLFERRLPESRRLHRSLDGFGRALVDAGSAVDAFGLVDGGHVIDGDSAGGTDVRAGSASDTLRLFDSYHWFTSN